MRADRHHLYSAGQLLQRVAEQQLAQLERLERCCGRQRDRLLHICRMRLPEHLSH